MNWFDELIENALKDAYLEELLFKAELVYTSNIFKDSTNNKTTLTEKEYNDLLKFADILCRSNKAEGRNKAYKIISLLYDTYNDDKYYLSCAKTILTKLGIFPTLQLLADESQFESNIEVDCEQKLKTKYQQSPFENKIFTDAQYNLFQELKNSNYFSFSGPTSFGKSFILESYIKHIIDTGNASDNMVILVPSRALINQVRMKLQRSIDNGKYKILNHPVIPESLKKECYKFIFVFTPERWISYISDRTNPAISYMFVDEAHKIISSTDARAPLYYHAISIALRENINICFSSPNVPNAEIFMELFGRNKDKSMVIKDTPVAQNRFFIDILERKATMFSDTEKEYSIPNLNWEQNFRSIQATLSHLGQKCQNIVYCNQVSETVSQALALARSIPLIENDKIDSLITLISSYIHKSYYLIDCLKHGVAFHFGNMPQLIREHIEKLFASGDLSYVFCTSTLLEGVNLPAKNIFILSNANGLHKFNDIDFWNLAGRAGRLSKELSGNIFCIRYINKKNYWKNPSDLEILRNKNISKQESILLTDKSNFYMNIGNAITNEQFTQKNASFMTQEIWQNYSNILCIDELEKYDTVLKDNFTKRVPQSSDIFKQINSTISVPTAILTQSYNIKIQYQENLFHSNMKPFPPYITYNSCLEVLSILSESYNWIEEESRERKPFFKSNEQLFYYAYLTTEWISGKPLSRIIDGHLKYLIGKNTCIDGKIIPFNINNKQHINMEIYKIMYTIENSLRFKIKNYMTNYALIYQAKTGDDSCLKWVDYIEYGTTNEEIITLQNLGCTRYLASFIKSKYPECIIQKDNFIELNEERLKSQLSQQEYPIEYSEMKSVFNW